MLDQTRTAGEPDALTWYLGSMNSTELGKYSSSELARLSHKYVEYAVGSPMTWSHSLEIYDRSILPQQGFYLGGHTVVLSVICWWIVYDLGRDRRFGLGRGSWPIQTESGCCWCDIGSKQ